MIYYSIYHFLNTDSTKFIQDVHVEKSYNQDNTIREAEISFQVCEDFKKANSLSQ